MALNFILLTLALLALLCHSANAISYSDLRGFPYTVSYDSRAILVNNSRVFLSSGSVHYPRSTPDMWPGILAQSASAGINMIEMYVFWNYHEAVQGVYDFKTENRDFLRFISNAADAGLFINLRLGPYVCAEWSQGGLPVWLRSIPGLVARSYNAAWQDAMSSFVKTIITMVEPYLARNGGPIILAQIENEYGNVEAFYPDHAKYITWVADYANSLNIDIPWIMCKQDDGPNNTIETCNGYYCDNWISGHASAHPGQPHLWTENWPGWYQAWGEPVPHRPSEDVAFSIARWVMKGGSHYNYYMWHGGTNFDRWAGGPFDITSYDYDVALNEYGHPNEPKYSHSALLHSVLLSHADAILGESTIPKIQSLGLELEGAIYGTIGQKGALLFLSNTGIFAGKVTYNAHTYSISAWSVLLVDGESMEVLFDTANTTHSLNTMQTLRLRANSNVDNNNDNDDEVNVSDVVVPVSSISWLNEPRSVRPSDPVIKSSTPLEHIATVEDVSDYLLYEVTVDVTNTMLSAGYFTLKLNSVNDYVNIFFNNTYVASAKSVLSSSFKVPVTSASQSQLSLFVGTMGLTNFGPYLESIKRGLVGSVSVNGIDVTNSSWTQQVALTGEVHNYVRNETVTWNDGAVPVNVPWTWYKLKFPSFDIGRSNSTRWALSLASMGKGFVNCNGYGLGRYWSIIGNIPIVGCGSCNYVGSYNPYKCRTGCGSPSQSLYHFPLGWMADNGSDNTCYLFEEIGGNPNLITLVQV